MLQVDFHGFNRTELERTVDELVGEVRLKGSSENYEFITGTGTLKEALKKYLKEMYDIDFREAHNSSGTILVTLE